MSVSIKRSYYTAPSFPHKTDQVPESASAYALSGIPAIKIESPRPTSGQQQQRDLTLAIPNLTAPPPTKDDGPAATAATEKESSTRPQQPYDSFNRPLQPYDPSGGKTSLRRSAGKSTGDGSHGTNRRTASGSALDTLIELECGSGDELSLKEQHFV